MWIRIRTYLHMGDLLDADPDPRGKMHQKVTLREKIFIIKIKIYFIKSNTGISYISKLTLYPRFVLLPGNFLPLGSGSASGSVRGQCGSDRLQ